MDRIGRLEPAVDELRCRPSTREGLGDRPDLEDRVASRRHAGVAHAAVTVHDGAGAVDQPEGHAVDVPLIEERLQPGLKVGCRGQVGRTGVRCVRCVGGEGRVGGVGGSNRLEGRVERSGRIGCALARATARTGGEDGQERRGDERSEGGEQATHAPETSRRTAMSQGKSSSNWILSPSPVGVTRPAEYEGRHRRRSQDD